VPGGDVEKSRKKGGIRVNVTANGVQGVEPLVKRGVGCEGGLKRRRGPLAPEGNAARMQRIKKNALEGVEKRSHRLKNETAESGELEKGMIFLR